MRTEIRFFFITLAAFFICSCSQKNESKKPSGYLSFAWSHETDSLLQDTTKTQYKINLLKRKVLESQSDTQAINRLIKLEANYDDDATLLTAEALKDSKAINYTEGIIKTLGLRGEEFLLNNDSASAGVYFSKGLTLAKETGNLKLYATLIYWQSYGYYENSVYGKCLPGFNTALAMADSINDNDLSAKCLYRIGEVDFYTYNNFDAMGYLNRAIQAAYQAADTGTVAGCLVALGQVYSNQAVYQTALFYYYQAIKMTTKLDDKETLDFCLSCIGEVYHNQADNINAMKYYKQSIKVAKEINDSGDIASALGSLAGIYTDESNYVQALEYYNKAAKIQKEEKDNWNLDYTYAGMGKIYRLEKDYANALYSYSLAMKIAGNVKDQNSYNSSLKSIGEIYRDQGNFAEALNYYNKVITLSLPIEDNDNLSGAYYDMGQMYGLLQDKDEALEYYAKALNIARNDKDNQMIADCLYGMGEIYVKTGMTQKAKKFAQQSLKASQASQNPNDIENASKLYSQAAQKLGDYKTALLMHQLYSRMEDTINNIQEVKQFSTIEYKSKEEQLQSEEGKTTAVFKAEADKNRAELKRQETLRYAYIGTILLVLIFSGIIYRGLLQNKKKALIISRQKEEVEKQKSFAEQQKALVDEKNKEIVDSINYAKRLQDAILPPVHMIEEHLPDSFILYKPKAIVAGDFYWMEKAGDEVLIAAADCTGHGVPGAMVSVVCSNALNRAVKEFHLREPGKILDKVRELVVETFERSGSDVKDGMDISLCALNTQTCEMKWSGANNPLWYLHDNQLKEVPPDKQPIGKHDRVTPFKTHNLKLKKGDTVYLFSDGFADQFGGEKGKKFKYRQIQNKLMELASSSLKQQGEALHRVFEDWKGMLEQVDDVLMIGIRL